MRGIAYKIDHQPRLTWPAVTEILDADGHPTGETVNNIDQLIADLPQGTAYEIIEEADAEAWWAANQPPPDPPTPEEMQTQFTAAIQNRLDAFARTRGYSGMVSLCSYATSASPRFGPEGRYGVEARDATWIKGYEILDAVMNGDRPIPTEAEVLRELPELEWPE